MTGQKTARQAKRKAVMHPATPTHRHGGNQVMKQRYLTAIATLSLAVLFAYCAAAYAGMIHKVPESLKVPANQVLALEAYASGVQIYECRAAEDDPLRYEWVFKAPEAELFDSAGKRIGRHYAGPTWESNDGSRVVGDVKARDNGPDPDAIPWLLLSAKSTSGTGVFSRTRSIQRMNTVGGKAPADGCSQAQAGKESRVAYKAAYYFYNATP
jgi:hypothetical protein